MMETLLLVLQDAFWSAIAALGFALLFNVPRRALLYCMAGGALGHALRTLLLASGQTNIELMTLLGATAIGFYAKWCANRLKLPSMIIGVTAVIPMVPGVFAYQTMIGLLQSTNVENAQAGAVLADAAVLAIKTGLVLVALATGIVAPSLVFRREKPIV